jgi:hypothetical protein
MAKELSLNHNGKSEKNLPKGSEKTSEFTYY